MNIFKTTSNSSYYFCLLLFCIKIKSPFYCLAYFRTLYILKKKSYYVPITSPFSDHKKNEDRLQVNVY